MIPALSLLAFSLGFHVGDMMDGVKGWAMRHVADTDWGARRMATAFLAPVRVSDPDEWKAAGLSPRTIPLDLRNGYWTQGLFVAANGPAKGTVLLLHGYANCKDVTATFAKRLHDAGYSTLSFDMRGHGSSSAAFCTFGYSEKADVTAVLDVLQEQGIARPPFMVVGTSMGAAVGIQAMENEHRLCTGVFDSSYDALKHVAPKWLRDSGINNPDPVYRAAKSLTGAPIESVSPVESLHRVDRPVFILHGTDDCMIPEQEAEALYASSPSPAKRILRIEHGNHSEALAEGHPWSDSVWKAVIDFLNTNTPTQPTHNT